MAAPRKTAPKKETPLSVVADPETITPAPPKASAPRKTRVLRNLTPTGLGLIGGIVDVEPEEVPESNKSRDVSWLYDGLRRSYELGKWQSLVVEDIDATERAVRLAADKLNMGVSIRTESVDIETESGDRGSAVRVYFLAKDKKKSAATTQASQAE